MDMQWTPDARQNELLLRRTHRCICDSQSLQQISAQGYCYLKVLERLPVTGLGYVIMTAEPVTTADSDYCCIPLSIPELCGALQYWIDKKYFTRTTTDLKEI
jgi:hypothetical protein